MEMHSEPMGDVVVERNGEAEAEKHMDQIVDTPVTLPPNTHMDDPLHTTTPMAYPSHTPPPPPHPHMVQPVDTHVEQAPIPSVEQPPTAFVDQTANIHMDPPVNTHMDQPANTHMDHNVNMHGMVDHMANTHISHVDQVPEPLRNHIAETHRNHVAEAHQNLMAETHRNHVPEPHRHHVAEAHQNLMTETHRHHVPEPHRHHVPDAHPIPIADPYAVHAVHVADKHMDQTMDVEDNNTTITASTVAPLPTFSQQPPASYTPEMHRPSTSYSDTAYQYTAHNGSRFNTPSDADTPPRPNYYDSSKETHMGQSHSRPSSQMGRYPTSESGSRSNSYQDQHRVQQPEAAPKNPSVVIKVGMVGDAQIGKTSLMVKYVEGSWDEDYIQTLGVNFMEKTISIRNTEITFSIWDLGGQREFVNMLPLVCNDAVAILFMFDLTRKSTLNSIKEWYRQGRGFNKTAIPFLVGTKYDHFVNFPREEQEEISNQAKRFARAMKASLIFSSTSHSINVQKIFKIVLSKAFDLKCTIPEIENIGEPLLLYQAV